MKTEKASQPKALPDYPTPAIMDQLIEIAAQGDHYLLGRVADAFASAGFLVRRLEREPAHLSVWVGYLTAKHVALAPDKKSSANQIRKLLAQAGVRIRAGELTVLDQRPNGQLRCAFLFGSELPPAIEF